MPVSRTGYVERLQREREAAKPELKDGAVEDAKAAEAKKAFLKVDPADFKGTRVPEKVLDIHGGNFKGAMPHLVDLGKFSERLEPWQANHFNRTLEQFYGAVAKQLDRAPEPMRPALTTESVGAMREMVTRLEGQGHGVVVPAMAAAVNVIDAGVRLSASGTLNIRPEEHSGAVRDTFQDVTTLAQGLEGREGVGSALNSFWFLAEQLESTAGDLTPAKRKEVRGAVAQFLAETAPRRGFDQALMAHLTDLVGKASAEAPKDFTRALRKAKETYFAEQAPLRNQTLQQLNVVPQVIPAGTPGHQYVTGVSVALRKIVNANPGGPASLFQAVEAFHAQALQELTTHLPTAEHAAPWQNVGKILDAAATSSGGEDVLKFLGPQLRTFVLDNRTQGGLAAAAASDSPGIMARELVNGLSQTLPPNVRTAEFNAAVGRLGGLEGGDAFRAATAAWPYANNLQLNAPMFDGLVEVFRSQKGMVSPQDVTAFVTSMAQTFPFVRQYFPNYAEAAQVGTRVARAAQGWPPNILNRLAGPMNIIRQQAPDALGSLMVPDSSGRPGLLQLVDPAIRYRHPAPENYFNNFANTAARAPNLDPAAKAELLRFAINLTRTLCNIDGDINVPYQRINQDWTAAIWQNRINPHALDGVPGHQPGVQGTAVEFLRAYPLLPPELALTAGVYLNGEQVQWLAERISGTRNKDAVRSLRDFIFGCVQYNQLGMIDTVRNSKSPPKAISAAIAKMGYDYRNPPPGGIPWAAMSAGLAAGGDPAADLVKEQAAKGAAGLNLNQLGGRVEPGGMAAINDAGAQVASITEFIGNAAAHQDRGFEYEDLRAPFLNAVKDVATGEWPSRKYENEVGQRMMAHLTPEQRLRWREEKVTPLNGEMAPAVAGEAFRDAETLLKGLVKALPREVKLGGHEIPPLGWDKASADTLRQLQTKTLDQLHNVEKGSAEHRRLGSLLGGVQRNLAVIDLQLALAEEMQKPGVDPKALLLKLKPRLQSAQSALARAGVRGSTAAIREILGAAAGLKETPRQGRYAVDEDGLAPLICSNVSGCLNAMNGFRRWGLVGALADPNIKMLRVYNNNKMVYRGFLKFFPVEMPGYKGPALWLDTPVADGGGNNEDLNLMMRHAIAKAQEMGVPFMTWNAAQVNPIAQQMGLQTQANVNVTFQVEEGNTPVQHSDVLFGGFGNIRANRGANPAWTMAKPVGVVVMPKVGG